MMLARSILSLVLAWLLAIGPLAWGLREPVPDFAAALCRASKDLGRADPLAPASHPFACVLCCPRCGDSPNLKGVLPRIGHLWTARKPFARFRLCSRASVRLRDFWRPPGRAPPLR